MTCEQNVRTAARLYEARDTAKTVLGDKYALRMFRGGQLLTKSARNSGQSVLTVAAHLAKKCEEDGRPFAAVVILAAAVELIEPSEVAS